MNRHDEVIEIDLIRLLMAMKRRIWAILLACVVGGGLAFAYAAFFITPLYQSSALMYVNNSSFSVGSTSFSISTSEISAAQSLVDTYIIILKTKTTLNEVIKEAGLSYNHNQLRDMIEAQSVNGTEVFEITVTSPDAKEAETIANTITQVLPDKVADIVDGSSVRVVDYAEIATTKASPNITRYTGLGILLGLVLACGVIVLLELQDDQIHSDEFLAQAFENIPVLASIPDLSEPDGEAYQGYEKGYGHSKKNGGGDEQ